MVSSRRAGSRNVVFCITDGRVTTRRSCCTCSRSDRRRIHSTASGYEAWTVTYQWENLYGYDFLYAGPLFIHQFSHAWIDFRGIQDRFMREKRCDYFENSRRAMHGPARVRAAQSERVRRLRRILLGPHRVRRPQRRMPSGPDEGPRPPCFGYAARGVPYGPDDGTLSGWAVLASLPFAPEIALHTARRNVARAIPRCCRSRRYASSFNPTLAQSPDRFGSSAGCFRWPLRTRPGHRGHDDRELSHWADLATDARIAPYIGAGLATRGFPRRLADVDR